MSKISWDKLLSRLDESFLAERGMLEGVMELYLQEPEHKVEDVVALFYHLLECKREFFYPQDKHYPEYATESALTDDGDEVIRFTFPNGSEFYLTVSKTRPDGVATTFKDTFDRGSRVRTTELLERLGWEAV